MTTSGSLELRLHKHHDLFTSGPGGSGAARMAYPTPASHMWLSDAITEAVVMGDGPVPGDFEVKISGRYANIIAPSGACVAQLDCLFASVTDIWEFEDVDAAVFIVEEGASSVFGPDVIDPGFVDSASSRAWALVAQCYGCTSEMTTFMASCALGGAGFLLREPAAVLELDDHVLGKGAFAEVFRARPIIQDGRRLVDDDVVFKTLTKRKGKEPNLFMFKNEVAALAAVQGHPNIISFYGLCRLQDMLPSSVDEPRWALMFEFCPDGDLRSEVMRSGPLPEHGVRYVVRKLLKALEYVHTRCIIHRDVKPENVLLKQSSPILADFGLACFLNDAAAKSHMGGTPGYMAPEIILKRKFSPKTDVFAIGVLAYVCITKTLPFAGADPKDKMRATVKNAVQIKGTFLESMSVECVDGVLAMLNKNDVYRPSTTEAFRQQWLRPSHTTERGRPGSSSSVKTASSHDSPESVPERESFKTKAARKLANALSAGARLSNSRQQSAASSLLQGTLGSLLSFPSTFLNSFTRGSGRASYDSRSGTSTAATRQNSRAQAGALGRLLDRGRDEDRGTYEFDDPAALARASREPSSADDGEADPVIAERAESSQGDAPPKR